MTYDELRPRLDTGDVVMMSATYFEDRVIEGLTGSPFSHIGMVVKKGEELFFWEATPAGGLVCELDGEEHTGVRLVPLEALLAQYTARVRGQFFFRLLEVDRKAEIIEAFWAFAKQVNRFPFAGEWTMFSEWVEGQIWPVPVEAKSYFCAELTAQTYRQMNLLPDQPPANGYSPESFSMKNTRLPLLAGAKLGDEIMAIWTQPQAAPATAKE